MDTILTEAESSRIEWTAKVIGIDSADALSTVCQIKSMLVSRGGLLSDIKAKLDAGFGNDAKGLRALFLMVKGALGGAIAGFAYKGLGTAVAAFIGVTAAAEIIALLLVVIGAMMLWSAISELPQALRALQRAGAAGTFTDI